jgi:hypothetical protein
MLAGTGTGLPYLQTSWQRRTIGDV